jgi:integrase
MIPNTANTITIREACAGWLEHSRTRKRNPIKQSSLAVYRSYAGKWINPLLGDLPLAEFTPLKMKMFITRVSVSLAPKSVNELVSFTKSILASVRDEQGLCVFNISFDPEFIDLPVVRRAEQKTPIFSAREIENVIAKSEGAYRCLWTLAAASGLRVGELLCIRVTDDGTSSFFDPSGLLRVRQTLWRGKPQTTKTEAGNRIVEIAQPVTDMLRAFANGRTGYLFGNGRPLDVSSARDRLTRITGSGNFHAFRRYRTTVLRKAHCNEAVLRFWLGHAGVRSMSDVYDRTAIDEHFRRAECDRIGLGFELPR